MKTLRAILSVAATHGAFVLILSTACDGRGDGMKPQPLITDHSRMASLDADAWSNRLMITFAGYADAETLTNFPMLIKLSDNVNGFSYSKCASSRGYDIRFTDASLNELDFDIDEWNRSTDSFVWVKVPYVRSTNTYVWLHFGNPNAGMPSCINDGSTWSESYMSVYHLGNTNALDFRNGMWVLDSAATNHGGGMWGWTQGSASNGCMAETNCRPGKVGRGLAFNTDSGESASPNEAVHVAQGGYSNFTGGLTFETWVNETSIAKTGEYRTFIEIDDNGEYMVFQNDGDVNSVALMTWADWEYGWGGECVAGAWTHFAATLSLDGIFTLYKNGAAVYSADGWTFPSQRLRTTNYLAKNGWGEYLLGSLDEARISATARSPAWLRASYKNQSSPMSYMTFSLPSTNRDAFTSSSASTIDRTGATLQGLLGGGDIATCLGSAIGTSPVPTGNREEETGRWLPPLNVHRQRTALASGTYYYARIYASNAVSGTIWSPDICFCTEPMPASNLTVQSSPISNSISLSWTKGTASLGTLVTVARHAAETPADGTHYTGNAVYGLGSAVGHGYVVYNGTGTNVNIVDIESGMKYWIGVFAYAGTGSMVNYELDNAPVAAQTLPFNQDGWHHRLYIEFTNYTAAEVLTNFPMLVKLSTNMAHFSFGHCDSPFGHDIRFTDASSSNSFDYEIDEWHTNGGSYLWVKIPLMKPTNTCIWMYYGNPSATTCPDYARDGSTWSEDYLSVHHLGNTNGLDFTSGMWVADSATYAGQGAWGWTYGTDYNGSMHQSACQPAKVGRGLRFNGSNEFAWLQDGYAAFGNGLTFSAWINERAIATNNGWHPFVKLGSDDYLVLYDHSGHLELYAAQAHLEGLSTMCVTNTWMHMAVSWDTSGNWTMYRNGVPHDSGRASGFPANVLRRDNYFATSDWGEWFPGSMDEVQISDTARSHAWIQAAYASQNAPDGYAIYGRPQPFVDITNASVSVAHAVASTGIGGSNSLATVGGLRWTNTLTAATGSLVAGTPWWSFAVGLGVGANRIVVIGTNVIGMAEIDTVTVTRAAAAFVDITNASMAVGSIVASTGIGGSNSVATVGFLRWTNALTTATGTLAAGASWWSFTAALAAGANPIMVYGTNVMGEVHSDTVTIFRATIPFVDITNVNMSVANAMAGTGIGGSNVAATAGFLRWTNILSTTTGVMPVGAPWWSANIQLAVGANQIVVSGTNVVGEPASDTITVTRAILPFLDITNLNASVASTVTSSGVGGSNSIGAVGFLRLTNTLTTASVVFAVGAPWWSTNLGLGLGANHIVVSGTNAWGETASDTATITRATAPFIDITNSSFTVLLSTTNTPIGGTNNAAPAGFMRLMSVAAGATNYTAAIAAATPWTAMVSNLVVGVTNVVTMTVTNVMGESTSDTVRICRLDRPGNPDSVLAFQARRGTEYGQVMLSWSNGNITVLWCTNRYYSSSPPSWSILSNGVSPPWTHTTASNHPSVYYRIVSGSYTGSYDTGKFDIDIAPGSIAWISFPFSVQAGCDILSEWFGQQLEARAYSTFDFPSLQRQDTPGGPILNCDYYIDDFNTGATGWIPDRAVVSDAGYVLFLPHDHEPVKLTGLGMVQTNNVTMHIQYNSIPWVGLAYDVILDMRNSGLADLFLPPQMYSTFNYDFVSSQLTPGGSLLHAEYYIDNWGQGTTNFFPSMPAADTLRPGHGCLIFFANDRVGTSTWNCARPY